MSGLYVPLVMIPRFTSYIGDGTYTTAPLDVSEFSKFVLTVWRGPLVGSPSSSPNAHFELVFEQSDDADVWSTFSGVSTINTPSANSVVTTDLTMRWLRIKMTLYRDANYVVAITCWAIGNLERRERG